MLKTKMQKQRGVSHSTATGRQFGIDFESMGQITWKLLTKNCWLYKETIENADFSLK